MDEDDFPPGSDMMGELLAGPEAGQGVEFELFNRLGPDERNPSTARCSRYYC